jgi:hypothetical protein
MMPITRGVERLKSRPRTLMLWGRGLFIVAKIRNILEKAKQIGSFRLIIGIKR